MPDITPNLRLKKPLGNENVTRAAYNENLDILDQNAANAGDFAAVKTKVDNLAFSSIFALAGLQGVSEISIPVALSADDYAAGGQCTVVATTDADVTILTAILSGTCTIVPTTKLDYGRYAAGIRAKTSNATASTAELEIIVQAMNNSASWVTIADFSWLGTDFVNGTTDYTWFYAPFELKYGLSSGTLQLPIQLQVIVRAKGSATNNVTISADMFAISTAGPAGYVG